VQKSFPSSKSMEQRSCIKVCVKNAINDTQTFEMLQKAFDDETLSRATALIGIGCLKKVVNLLMIIIVLDGHQHQTVMKMFKKSQMQYCKIVI